MLQACYFAFQKTMKLTNRDLYDRILCHLSRRDVTAIGDPRARDFLIKAFGDVVHESDISSVISKFLSAVRSKWDAASRHKDHFEQKHANWLSGVVYSDFSDVGRPETPFEEASDKTKKRKTSELGASNSTLKVPYFCYCTL